MSQDALAIDVAYEAAEAAGKVLLEHFHAGVTARAKQTPGSEAHEPSLSYNLVSDADLDAERTILDRIRSARPHDAVMSEETHQEMRTAERLWIVDPLDGTNNFTHGIPHFAVSIGYLEGGQPKLGIVHNPVTGDWFVAQSGRGATLNGKRLSTTSADRLDECLVGVGFYYDRGAMMRATLEAVESFFGNSIHGIRRMGTASLDLCYVAAGRFGVFFEYELLPWDYAAGALLVTEAGGRITDGRGRPLSWGRTSVVAASKRLHAPAIEIVERYHPE